MNDVHYHILYNNLKKIIGYDDEQTPLGFGLVARNFDFHSRIRHSFSENVEMADILAAAPDADSIDITDIRRITDKKDPEISENLHFRYRLIMPENTGKAQNVIILFHGFNEKLWHKYLPWAAHLSAKTDRAVLLFPIAFHMNRAPKLWTDIRSMNRASKIRRAILPAVIDSSLSNVAISTRLHYRPDRFIWSGLESYYDVMDLVDDIRGGRHPAIDAEAGIDFLSYSVGSFLGQTIMMTNKNGYFSQSKYAVFCGGPVFNRLSPVSKFILDSEASVRLYSYLVEHLESHMRDNPELRNALDGDREEGRNFRSLLNYRDNLAYREDKLRGLIGRVHAFALGEDRVVPPYEVFNTLRGSRQNIDIPVEVIDFPYPYRHEDPFPINEKWREAVDTGFRRTFDRLAGFLTS